MGDDAATSDPFHPAKPFRSEGPTSPLSAGDEAAREGASEAASARMPASIGGYRVVSLLGQGGMGAVYLAEQEKPHRRVALKLMRPGVASERALRRFEHEAEILGRLLHPGIAQIYEAGLAEGVPFFAMELVEGRTLLEYCREKRMGTRERLELFARICDGVHHAHTKGVIHRDLKPGNILVAEVGPASEPQPKILDFGVARATDADIRSTTMRTDVGQIIGTLPYMSPEQVGGLNEDLDTRSDVYALGVVLYELLTGRMPYDLERRMIHEAARIIREDDPARLSSVDARLRGDVETIVAKAMEKSRERRYQSAIDLGSDVRRYLADEPIAARPPSAAYQFGKFARRNRALVAGVGATFVVLVAGLAGTTYGLMEAGVERDRANERAGAATAAEAAAEARRADALAALARAEKAEKEERTRADELQKVSEFQAQMLAQVDPTEAGELLTADVTAKFEAALVKAGVPEGEVAARSTAFREQWAEVNATDAARELIDRTILRPAVAAIDAQFADQPVVDATLRQTLADRYLELGMYDAAEPLQERSLETRRRVLGAEHPSTLTSINNLAALLMAQGRFGEAEPHFRDSLAKSRRVLGEEHADSVLAISNLGLVLKRRGRLEEADSCYRDALEKYRRVLGEEHPETLNSINCLASLCQDLGKLVEAESLYHEALGKCRRVLGDEHPTTLVVMGNMASLLLEQRRLDEAEPYFREVLDTSRRVRGEEHPDSLGAINNLGALLRDQGNLDEAEALFREALEKRRRVLGVEHPDTLTTLNSLATLMLSQNRLSEAEPLFREAMVSRRRSLGEDHPDTLGSISNMGAVLRMQGKLAESEPFAREALETRRRVQGDEHPETLASIQNLGALLLSQGRLSEAESYIREALEKRRRVLGDEHRATLTSINAMGTVLRQQGSLSEAETYYREALEIRRRVLGDDHPDTLASINSMSIVLGAQGMPREAEPFARELMEMRRRALGEEHPETLGSISGLGAHLQAQAKHAEAVELLAPCESKVRVAFVEADAPRLASFLMNLGSARAGLGEFASAEANLLEAHAILLETRGAAHKDTVACVQAIVDLYAAWDVAEPGKGYDAKAAEWKTKVAAEEEEKESG